MKGILLMVSALSFVTVLIAFTASIRASVPLLDFAKSSCTPQYNFSSGGFSEPNGILINQHSIFFESNGYVSARICEPMLLRLEGRGIGANNEFPRLIISKNGNIIKSIKFGDARTEVVNLSSPGIINLAFLNDYYSADVRMATFLKPRMNVNECRKLRDVHSPADSAGIWQPEYDAGTIVRKSPPITIDICSDGIFEVFLKGSIINSETPRILFSQNGSALKLVSTSDKFTLISFAVKKGVLEMSMDNPYANLLANRALEIINYEFINPPRSQYAK